MAAERRTCFALEEMFCNFKKFLQFFLSNEEIRSKIYRKFELSLAIPNGRLNYPYNGNSRNNAIGIFKLVLFREGLTRWPRFSHIDSRIGCIFSIFQKNSSHSFLQILFHLFLQAMITSCPCRGISILAMSFFSRAIPITLLFGH